MEIKKNDSVTVEIVSLGYNGEGISKDLDKPIFIPYALIGEKVEAKVILVKKDFYVGKLENVLIKSQDRVEPLCPVFKKCGGCQLQHLSYQKQLDFKRNHVKDCFRKIACIEIEPNNTVPSTQYEYRNKFALPIGTDNNNNTLVGMFANNSHRIIDIDNCIITQNWNKKLISVIKKFIKEFKLTAYNEISHTGLLKHLVARKVGDSLSVIIVINGKDLPHKKILVDRLKKVFNEDFCLYLNINLLNNNVILGEKFINVFGSNPVDNFEGILTEIHPNSFYQVNDNIKTQIYKKVLDEIKDTTVIDAYSGAGTISNFIAKHFKETKKDYKVYSVEIIPQAVEGAIKTSKLNGVENIVNHIEGDCAIVIPKLAKSLNSNFSIILDPPRKGCEESVLKAILESKPEKICYISCDPSTLARDMKNLKENYTITSLTPYDMFPNTKHIETLICLCKQ
ncbi:MAG: 23S rRNA (uracil(1939)-C(5))-methyltransferase RlmD [Clostridia bacterium]|nr:23S rRNA (uracil(1939)-C(5))-methyltransferase RlmD [Clostridia bacterium]